MKIIYYSVNIGGHDHFYNTPLLRGKECYYITDTDFGKSNWSQLLVEAPGNPKTEAGWYKINSHNFSEHDISVYMDGSVRINRKFFDLVSSFASSDKSIMMCRHPSRNCTYEEGKACIRLKKERLNIVNMQLDHYRRIGFANNLGMVATCVIMRKNTEPIRIFNQTWWKQIQKWSKRDQLSVMYASWLTGINIDCLDLDIYNNVFFKVSTHKNKKKQ